MSETAAVMEEWRSTLDNKVIKSPCAPIPIPETTLIERILALLRERAAENPDKGVVIEGFDHGRWITHQQIHDRALCFAAFLASRGVSIGDRVTLAFPNSIEWPVIHLGTWAAGAAVVGSCTAFKLADLIYQWRDSGSSVVVTSEKMLDLVVQAAASGECPNVRTIVCVRTTSTPLPDGVIDYEDAIRHEPVSQIATVTLDTVCFIVYTSGTTGQPKGVIHTHRTLHAAVETLSSHWNAEVFPKLGGTPEEWKEDARILNTSFMHIYGFNSLNWLLVAGGQIVLTQGFDGEVFLAAVEKFKPRFLLVTPAIFAYLAKDERGKAAALTNVKLILSGGAPLRKLIIDEFIRQHPDVKYIAQGYGMSETITSHQPLLLQEGVDASVGVPTTYFEQKIIDASCGLPCKRGQWGELCVRGASQTIGYLNKPEATQALIDEDGWVHTGDIAFIDANGFLNIVDRMKEIIHVNYKEQTMMVSSSEIEGILLLSPRIRDVAIIGIPDAVKGELVRAFVVKADEKLTENDVQEFLNDKIAEYKRVTAGVVFLDEIPRTSGIGKILKHVLRDMAVTGTVQSKIN